MEFELPKSFTEALTKNWGETGTKWLATLPSIVQKCQKDWGFTLESNPYDLYTNFITPIRLEGGQEAVLKVGFPEDEGVLPEMESLQYYDEQYSVRLLKSNTESLAFILEKLTPGSALRDIHLTDDAKATSVALPLLQNVPAAVPEKHNFPSLADWAKVIGKTQKMTIKGNITPELLDKARAIFGELDASKTEEKLLHGDLHHDNILYDERRGWIAIDPKGVIGDPTFNSARFIINNWSKRASVELLPDRIAAIAKALGHDEKRIAGWAYVDYIISNCWMLEDGGESKIDAAFADALLAYVR